MGLFSWAKKVLGIGKKKEKKIELEQPKELPKIVPKIERKVSVNDFKVRDELKVTNVPKIPKKIITISDDRFKQIEDSGYERSIAGTKQSGYGMLLAEDLVLKKNKFKSQYKLVKDEDRELWLKLINPDNKLINTGYYDSQDKLDENKYDIYRNILLKNIDNKQMLDDIYRSRIMDKRIVGVIFIKAKFSSERGPDNYGDLIYEIVGFTPDKAINSGILSEIRQGKTYDNGVTGLLTDLKRLSGNEDINPTGQVSGSHLEILSIQIGFNYA